MSEKEDCGTDPELENFLRENKEMIKRLFKEEKEIVEKLICGEKGCFKGAFEEEKSKAEKFKEEKKDKAKDTAQEMFNAFTDPEVQKHFMAMGMEFMMAVSALISAMPVPEKMKDMAAKAEEARKKAEDMAKNRSGRDPDASPEKIEIKPAAKKKSGPKTPPAGKEKTSD